MRKTAFKNFDLEENMWEVPESRDLFYFPKTVLNVSDLDVDVDLVSGLNGGTSAYEAF